MNSMQSKDTPQSARATEAKCTLCLPFCGLSSDSPVVERLKACGVQLLEQVVGNQPGVAESVKNS